MKRTKHIMIGEPGDGVPCGGEETLVLQFGFDVHVTNERDNNGDLVYVVSLTSFPKQDGNGAAWLADIWKEPLMKVLREVGSVENVRQIVFGERKGGQE